MEIKEITHVSKSSAKAEYRAFASLTFEIIWLIQLLCVFYVHVPPVKGFLDSKSTIQLTSNPLSHKRSKYVDIDVHFIREYVQTGFLKLVHVSCCLVTKQLA